MMWALQKWEPGGGLSAFSGVQPPGQENVLGRLPVHLAQDQPDGGGAGVLFGWGQGGEGGIPGQSQVTTLEAQHAHGSVDASQIALQPVADLVIEADHGGAVLTEALLEPAEQLLVSFQKPQPVLLGIPQTILLLKTEVQFPRSPAKFPEPVDAPGIIPF